MVPYYKENSRDIYTHSLTHTLVYLRRLVKGYFKIQRFNFSSYLHRLFSIYDTFIW